jgi:RNA polymerase sigma-54 factor
MKQSLSLKLGHKLKLTPRLQQAITLLQLSSVDLEGEIRNALESNPFLEETSGPAPAGGVSADESVDSGTIPSDDLADRDPTAEPEPHYGEQYAPQETGDHAAGMASRRDDASGIVPSTKQSYDNAPLLDNLTHGASLADRLREQLRIAPLDDRESLIAESILENINEDGYLDATIEELTTLLNEFADISSSEVERVLRIVQSMDPPGIGARDLRECLRIQLTLLDDSENVRHALTIVEKHFDALSRRDFGGIRRQMVLSEAELSDAIGMIRQLDPRPAARLDDTPPQYVVPDILVRHGEAGWQVLLNEDAQSKLTISPSTRTYLAANTNREDTLYFRQRYQEAKWFLQSLKQRNETILRVAQEIMRHQSEFLEHGEKAMRPLTLRQVAEALDLHESTVSRATSQKYILSPRGTHELKYFFSSHLASDRGDALSSTAIQAQIRTLIANEPGSKPISDQKIADHFKSLGISVARRTVAKYRELMHIPPSSQRKGL